MSSISPLTTPKDLELAKSASREVSTLLQANEGPLNLIVVATNGEPYSFPPAAISVQLMNEILFQPYQGNDVSITPTRADQTTQEAADLLNMSRPTLIKLLDSGVIAHSRTGNRRKVAFVEVMRYKQELDSKRLSALDELSALDQELALGY